MTPPRSPVHVRCTRANRGCAPPYKQAVHGSTRLGSAGRCTPVHGRCTVGAPFGDIALRLLQMAAEEAPADPRSVPPGDDPDDFIK
jgi:hypothetical protein